MSTSAYYLTEAARCRELATRAEGADAIRRWLQMAVEYEQLAESLAFMPQAAHGAPEMQRMPMQQQEVQQQQSKTEPGEKE